MILRDGVIFLGTPSGEHALTAPAIFAAIFGGGTTVEGISISEADFRQTNLKFSDCPCSPALLVTATLTEAGPRIVVEAAGTEKGKHAVAKADYVILDGTWYPLPHGSLDDISAALANLGATIGEINFGQYLRLRRAELPFRLIDEAEPILAAGSLGKALGIELPLGLQATLFPYQQAGFQWLAFMARNSLGSILADEMGLGKTIQTIAVLQSELNAGRRPNLVVCPATIVENWRREIHKFAPNIQTLVHAGPRRTGRSAVLRDSDVAICSYETMVADISLLSDIRWNLVLLDEAQAIKNPDAQRTQRIKRIPRRVAVAITGTPVENTLRDIWSISDFAAPDQLGPLHHFERRFPDTQPGAAELEPFVSAFMLRRRVQEVAQDLPARIDIPVPLQMDEVSAVAYEEIRAAAAAKNPSSPDFTAMIPLRMFCAHPWAAQKLRNLPAVDCSVKLQRCLEIIEEIVAQNEKALVFTSFQETADLLRDAIADRFSIFVETIDGRLPVGQRQTVIDTFSAIAGPAALVLNPRAAGVGLNITAANHVIHYNLEWNPAVEDQASARSHRRGQTRPVTVHRLFFTDTVEEVVDDRMARKRTLAASAVVGTDGSSIEVEDIRRALTISPVHSQ